MDVGVTWLVEVDDGVKPSRELVSNWLKEVWDDLEMEIVQKSWSSIGYTSYMEEEVYGNRVLEVEMAG